VHGNARFTCPEPNCDVTAKNKDHIKDHIAAIHRKEPRYTLTVPVKKIKFSIYKSKSKVENCCLCETNTPVYQNYSYLGSVSYYCIILICV
jgi:hypothetical protein